MAKPPRAKSHEFTAWEDTAGYLVDVGTVSAPGRHTSGQLAHARPYIVSGKNFFVFPVGTEGFERSGAAGVSIHKYLGEVAADAHVFHREEGRIQLMGTFPGITSPSLMVDCLQILRSAPAEPGLVLYAPGVFEREQYVVAESWNFTHPEDNRDHSITYSITMLRTGEGQAVKDPRGTLAPPNPSKHNRPKGRPTRFFTVVEGARTLKQIAFTVYHDSNKWTQLVQLNAGELAAFQRGNVLNAYYNLPTYQLPTYRWEIGTKFRY
jgi:hypothetical protein